MNLIAIGANGMLGQDLQRAAADRGVGFHGVDLPEVNLLEPATFATLPTADAVINCAAFTRVDDAETEREAAWAVNAEGAGNLARWCAGQGLPLIHISTDYVFDGTKGSAYTEDDPVNPLSEYGKSKLGGETAVMEAGGTACIVRTQSLYGVSGKNFVKAILTQVRKGRTELTVVEDQVSAPTYTRHLAEALLNLAGAKAVGVVHVAATGGCSWHAFACGIVAKVGAAVEVKPIAAATLNQPAHRPPYSVLDTSRYRQLTGAAMPTWEEGLEAYLAEEPLAAEIRAGS